MARTLWAVSDLHVTFKENQAAVDRLAPRDPGDWLIVAGDVAERIPKVVQALKPLNKRFAKVIWVSGTQEMFNRSSERIRGLGRYRGVVRDRLYNGEGSIEAPW